MLQVLFLSKRVAFTMERSLSLAPQLQASIYWVWEQPFVIASAVAKELFWVMVQHLLVYQLTFT